MERRVMNTLIVDENDLNCNCKDLKLEDINQSKLAFINTDLEKFDLIVYKGKQGTKIIRSRYW
jgi:hypothetical protein